MALEDSAVGNVDYAENALWYCGRTKLVNSGGG